MLRLGLGLDKASLRMDYGLFLRTGDASLFEGAKLVQVKASSLPELLASVAEKLQLTFSGGSAGAGLRLVAADGSAVTEATFGSLGVRGKFSVERVESDARAAAESGGAEQDGAGAGAVAAGAEADLRASTLAQREASAERRSREMVVKLDYAAWRAAVLAQLEQQPGFESLRWTHGQQGVARYSSQPQAAAALAPTAAETVVRSVPFSLTLSPSCHFWGVNFALCLACTGGSVGEAYGGFTSRRCCQAETADPQQRRRDDTQETPLRISYHLAAFLPLFHRKQVHFEGCWLKRVAISCEIGSRPSSNDIM